MEVNAKEASVAISTALRPIHKLLPIHKYIPSRPTQRQAMVESDTISLLNCFFSNIWIK
jgi:hypothetical protein